MAFTGQDKVLLSDIVKGLSLAIIEVCRTLEHQKGVPAENLSTEIHSAVTNLPHDPTHSYEYRRWITGETARSASH